MAEIDIQFLHDMLMAPSPSGYEQPVQRIVRKRAEKFSDSVVTDLHGNLIAGVNTKAERRILIGGHADQIGMMVRHISKEGFIYVSAVGGLDIGVLHAACVTLHGAKGPVTGVIGRKPIHQQSAEERDKTKNDIEKIWIDIGAKNQKEAEKFVAIGDPVTFELRSFELKNGLICGPGLDNKVGVFVAFETLRLCAEAGIYPALYAVSTVQEEVGLRGATTSAYAVNPEVAIAVDVTHTSDSPASENFKGSPCKLGAGPAVGRGPSCNPVVEKMLKDVAKKAKIPFQESPGTRPVGNDASAMQMVRGGVASGTLGVPNRYMHTQVEVCSVKDLENTVKMLVKFVEAVNKKSDFRPM